MDPELVKVAQRGVRAVEKLMETFPPIEKILSENSLSTTSPRSREAIRAEFFEELDKYKRFLESAPQALHTAEEENPEEKKLNVLSRHKRTFGFGRSYDAPTEQECVLPIPVIIQQAYVDFLEDLIEIVKLFYTLDTKNSRTKFEENAYVKLATQLAVVEGTLPRQTGCMNGLISEIHDSLVKARALLETQEIRLAKQAARLAAAEAAGGAGGNAGGLPSEITDMFESLALESDDYKKVNKLLKIFRRYLVLTYGDDAKTMFTSKQLRAFLDMSDVLANPEYGTDTLNTFDKFIALMLNIFMENNLNTNYFTPEQFQSNLAKNTASPPASNEASGGASGGANHGGRRRLRNRRTTRKQRRRSYRRRRATRKN